MKNPTIPIKKHYRLVQAVINKLSIPDHIEREDLFQEGLLGLWQATRDYTTTGGASYETFATRYITHRIIDYIDHQSTMYRVETRAYPLIQNPVADYIDSFDYVYDRIRFMEEALKSLTRKQSKYLIASFAKPISVIALEENVSVSAVNQTIYMAKKNIQKNFSKKLVS